jgi:hypothetical protein
VEASVDVKRLNENGWTISGRCRRNKTSASASDDVSRANGDSRFACTDVRRARNEVARATGDCDAANDDFAPAITDLRRANGDGGSRDDDCACANGAAAIANAIGG